MVYDVVTFKYPIHVSLLLHYTEKTGTNLFSAGLLRWRAQHQTRGPPFCSWGVSCDRDKMAESKFFAAGSSESESSASEDEQPVVQKPAAIITK